MFLGYVQREQERWAQLRLQGQPLAEARARCEDRRELPVCCCILCFDGLSLVVAELMKNYF
jgi:hypothetical protein